MTNHVLSNTQSAFAGDRQWNGDTLTFAGTSSIPHQLPMATFSGANRLGAISVVGTRSVTATGGITISAGATVASGSLNVAGGILDIVERPAATVILNGSAHVSGHATFTVSGTSRTGTVQLNSTVELADSTMNVDAGVNLTGRGTIHLTGATALLRVGNVGAGETVKLDAGMLSLANGMTFQGTVTDSNPAASRISPLASVAVFNAADAVRAVFNRSSGMLDLFNGQGREVAAIHFGGHGDLYTAWTPSAGNGTGAMVISSHPSANALPVMFTS